MATTHGGALTPFVSMLLDKSKILYARCEGMRLVRAAHGLLSDDEYQRRLADHSFV